MLDELLARAQKLPPEVHKQVLDKTKHLRWVPNPGPQTRAYFCKADELFYGGEAGGGKSALITGLAVNEHERSLLLRRHRDDAKDLAEQELLSRILDGNRDGWNGADLIYRLGKRTLEYGGCKDMEDRQRYKGKPHDLKAFDEITDFLEAQYRFIIGWNRSSTAGQRCRVVVTGNPPTTAEGLWVIKRWAAWLDPKHPNPAKDGELRWYVTDDDDNDVPVDGPGEYEINGKMVAARSRTFIRAGLSDNPELGDDYKAVLDALPKELRDAYRDGKFSASLRDNPWQCIPTAWVLAAQQRWNNKPPAGIPMCAMGVDVAQGGDDNNVISIRHDSWFAPLTAIPGKQTPVGTDIAGVIVAQRRDNAMVIIDCGGGYGGSAFKHMVDNGIDAYAYKGAEGSESRTEDRTIGFVNRRTEAWWRFREALDPGQRGGSQIALPNDSRLLSDLTAPTYDTKNGKIRLEAKDELIKRLGRSTDHGDAVVICWYKGPRMASDYGVWKDRITGSNHKPKVILGHQAARRRR